MIKIDEALRMYWRKNRKAKLASKVLKLSLLSLVLMALVLTSYTTANASHRHEKHPIMGLYIPRAKRAVHCFQASQRS
jgi:hypothetical protein